MLTSGSSREDSTDLTPARTPDILTRALSRRPPRMSNSVFSANGGKGSLPTIFIEDALMPGANASGVATPFTSMTSPSLNASTPSMCAVGVRCVSPEKYMPLPFGSATSAKTPDAERHPTTCVTTPVAQTSPAWAASVLVSAATSEKDMAASSIHVAVMSLFYQISCVFWRRGFQPRQEYLPKPTRQDAASPKLTFTSTLIILPLETRLEFALLCRDFWRRGFQPRHFVT